MVTIRHANIGDLGAITEIYNQAILTTTATFDTEPKGREEQKQWFEKHDSKHPILLAELDGEVVAWASLSKWSDRCAYAGTGEASIYVKEGHRGGGIGKRLLHQLLEEGRKAGLHTIIGRVAGGNEVSLRLLGSCGFTSIGRMREVGHKFGKLLDVDLLQAIFEQGTSASTGRD